MTMAIGLALFYHIRWDYFGITEGLSYFYLNSFEIRLGAYLWIANEMGLGVSALFLLLVLGYLWMGRQIYIALLINYKRGKL